MNIYKFEPETVFHKMHIFRFNFKKTIENAKFNFLTRNKRKFAKLFDSIRFINFV